MENTTMVQFNINVRNATKSCPSKQIHCSNSTTSPGMKWSKLYIVWLHIKGIDYIAMNLRKEPMHKSKAWLLSMKILYLLPKMPKPVLIGVIQINEK